MKAKKILVSTSLLAVAGLFAFLSPGQSDSEDSNSPLSVESVAMAEEAPLGPKPKLMPERPRLPKRPGAGAQTVAKREPASVTKQRPTSQSKLRPKASAAKPAIMPSKGPSLAEAHEHLAKQQEIGDPMQGRWVDTQGLQIDKSIYSADCPRSVADPTKCSGDDAGSLSVVGVVVETGTKKKESFKPFDGNLRQGNYYQTRPVLYAE